MEIKILFVFLSNYVDVKTFSNSIKVHDFQLGVPSSPQVANNGVEIIFSDATIKINKNEELPAPLINISTTLQGRLGNYADIRSPEGESEVMRAVQGLVKEYISSVDGCQIFTDFLRVEVT